MPLQVTSDNLDVTPSMRALVDTKIPKIMDRLTEFPKDMVDLRVVLNKGVAEDTFEARVTLTIGGKIIVGEQAEYTLESALIRAVDETLRQYKKDKTKKDAEDWEKRRKMKTFQFSDDA